MKDFLLSFLASSLTVSAVIAFMLILSKYLKNKFTAACRFVIWTVIIVRLLIPFGVFGSKSLIRISLPYIPNEETVETGGEEFPLELPETENAGDNVVLPSVTLPDIDVVPPAVGGDMQVGVTVPDTVAPQTSAPATPTQPDETIGNEADFQKETEKKNIGMDTVLRLIFALWLGGAVSFFAVNLSKYIVFACKLNRNSQRLSDFDLSILFVDICNEKKVYNAPALYESDSISSPLLYGYFRSRIVLPSRISYDKAKYIFAHEITHFRRCDIWLKLAALISNSLNWFNPLVYMAVREFNHEMELSCDELVLKELSEEDRIEYSRVLLDTAGKCRNDGNGLTTAFDSKESNIKRRINNILDATKKHKGTVLIIAVFVVCIAAGLIFGFDFKKEGQGEPMPPDETNELISQGWIECETTDKYDGINIVEKHVEYGFEYVSSDTVLPCVLADTRSNEVVFFDGKKSYLVPLDSKYNLRQRFSVKLCKLNEDKKRDAVITFGYSLYAVKTDGDSVYYKKLDFSSRLIDQFKNNFNYTYFAETKKLEYFDGVRSLGSVDLDLLVSVMGADFSRFEFDDELYYYADEDNIKVGVQLIPVYTDGKSSRSEFTFSLSSFIGYGAVENPKISFISVTKSINVTPDMVKDDYSKNNNYVSLFSGITRSGSVNVYGERTGYRLVFEEDKVSYVLPVKWKNVTPYRVSVCEWENGKDQYFIALYNSTESFALHHIKLDSSNRTADIVSVNFDDLLAMINDRFSYSYDKENKIITYYTDNKINKKEHLGKVFEGTGSDFAGFEYVIDSFGYSRFSYPNGVLKLFPKLEDGTIIGEGYNVELRIELYYTDISDKICLNPVQVVTSTSGSMATNEISDLVMVADELQQPVNLTKYREEQNRYVLLSNLSDGSKLLGKYGGKEMLYFVNGSDYHKIDLSWLSANGMILFSRYIIDFDSNGRNELVLVFDEEMYLFDKVDGKYKMYTYSFNDAITLFNKDFSYKYDKNSKVLRVYNKGVEAGTLNFGSKLQSGEDFLGFHEPTINIYSASVLDNLLRVSITLGGSFKEGYAKNFADVYSRIYLKYSPSVGIKADRIDEMNLRICSDDAEVYNSMFYSNSEYWSLRSDEEFFLHVEGKNGEHFCYPNLVHLHYSTWVGPYYEPNSDEEPIVWGLFKEYAPRMYVFEDGFRALITYLCANVNEGYGRVERAVIVDLVSGRILHDGGMTERMMFDAHGISEEIRKKYHFISQAMPKQYDITFNLSEVLPGILRFENSIISFNGNMVLKGYTDYSIDSWEVSDYVITENTAG